MKIAISGAGIAGPTLAYWLHRTGHEPTLIERAPQFRRGGYVVDFWGLGYTIAERMTLLPCLHEAGYAVREVRFVDPSGRRVGGFSTDVFRRITSNRFTSLPRADLAALIYRTIEDKVETIFNNSISTIEPHDAAVRIGFEHGPARDFDLVVGADGLHSTVRSLVFGPESQFEKQLGYRVAACEVEGYPSRDDRIYVSCGMPGRQVARFSLRNDRTMFFFMFVDDTTHRSIPCDVEERKAVLRRRFADAGWECPQILRSLDHVPEIYYDRVSQIQMERWSKGRVVLIGDAAACISLLGGEGCGLAMTEAYVLAGELKRAHHDFPEAFRSYEQKLRPFIEAKQKSALRFASAFAPKTRAGLWIRNQVTKLLRIPAIAEFFVARDLRDNFDLPSYEM